MMYTVIALTKLPNDCWGVVCSQGENGNISNTKSIVFETIEFAADNMIDVLNVPDEEIDDALISMTTKNHNKSIFLDGCFLYSELE